MSAVRPPGLKAPCTHTPMRPRQAQGLIPSYQPAWQLQPQDFAALPSVRRSSYSYFHNGDASLTNLNNRGLLLLLLSQAQPAACRSRP